MVNLEKALIILEDNKLNNINAINFIKAYKVYGAAFEASSLLIYGKSDELWAYVCAETEEQLSRLMEKNHTKLQYFAVVEDWMLPILSKDKDIDWVLKCEKLVLPEIIHINSSVYEYEPLRQEDAEYIFNKSKYKQYTSIEFIKERIKKGISLCRRENGEPIAWIMTQDDGAIGFLNVVEEYRRKGYAKDILLAMLYKLRADGTIAFAHIEDTNIASMNLALSLGFQRYKTVNWIKLKNI